jgi:hypothetical protein
MKGSGTVTRRCQQSCESPPAKLNPVREFQMTNVGSDDYRQTVGVISPEGSLLGLEPIALEGR